MDNSKIEWKIDDELAEYPAAVSFMEKRVADIIDGRAPQLIWLTEHPALYTAGVSAKDEDLLDAEAFPVFKTNRGGKYTHHCPGMKIVYVMLDLKQLFAPEKPDVARFVEFLENWVITFLAKLGVEAFIRKGRVGIWVMDNGAEKKIGAIGIKLRKWVSYHGIAINIDPDLAGFDNIVPCGIKDFGITSLREMKVDLSQDFDKLLRESFYEISL